MTSMLQLFSPWPQPEDEKYFMLLTFYDENAVLILSMLSPLIAEILGREGLGTLLLFLQHYGGTRLPIRALCGSMKAGLHEHLSRATRDAVRHMFSDNEATDIPSSSGVFNIFRRVAIKLALKDDLPLSQIARQVGVTQRHLRHELKLNKNTEHEHSGRDENLCRG